jgi:hypothetical protein
MSFTRTSRDAEELMKQAYQRTGKIPRVIYTDKLRAYLEGIEKTFGADTKHRQGSPFDIENNTNLIERFHGTIKERTKVIRGLHTIKSARAFMDGWLVHYNYFRPHMSLNDRTPSQVAGINFPFRNWKDITEQSYEKTARIPMRVVKPRIETKIVKPVTKDVLVAWMRNGKWYLAQYPYESNDDVSVMVTQPQNAIVVQDTQSAYRLIQRLNGKAPSGLFTSLGLRRRVATRKIPKRKTPIKLMPRIGAIRGY